MGKLLVRAFAAIAIAVATAVAPIAPSEASVNAAGITLPWAVGQSWSANGPHTDTGAAAGNRNAIDVSGGDGRVLAAGSGTVRLGSCVGGQNFWIDHPGGWRTTYYHVTGIRVANGQTVNKGDWIATTGTATPCGGSASAAHLHFSLWKDGQAYPLDGMSLGGWTVRQGSGNYLGSWRRDSDGYTYNVPSTGYMSCGCINNDGSGSAAITDGQFVSYAGHVYRIAGGAPLYVSSWDRFGGPKPTTALSDAQWNGLRLYPRDGTLISGQAPGHPEHGTVFTIAGGAPIYVSSYSHIGGDRGTIAVDLSAIHNAGGGSPWNHLLYRPADGTLISGWAPGSADHGTVYRIAGGAPVYVSSFANIGGDPGTVGVDLAAIHNAGQPGRWSHLNWYPAEGTILNANGAKYQVRGGAPYAHTTSADGTRIDPMAIQRAGDAGVWAHLKAPATAVVPAPTPTPTGNQVPTPTTGTDVRTLSVRAVKHRSRLRVVVGPASAEGDYAFIVQKRTKRGTWKRIISTTTRGPKDVRVLDLRRGTYRVFLPSVNGLARIDSAVVSLKR